MAEDLPGTSNEPAPPVTFDALPLSADLRKAIDEVGYVHPTPVQLAVWDPATRGKDAVVQARTGTGKTASFGLPIIDHLVRKSTSAVQALVLCPTRELALQVSSEITKLSKYKGTEIIAVYGGAPMQKQIDAIAGGAQVVVGTPGRVLDHIRRGTLPTAAIKLLVLDEADEMLSMGFERELTAILESLPPTRQTLLFSATLPPDIERMAKNRLKDPEFVTLSGDHVGALSIQHFNYIVTGDKPGTLARIIEVENPESAVIFCNTRDATEAVAQALVARGFDADWLNGDLPQSDREKVMTATRSGKLRFLVATDVAARGIDISHLTHVINYDFPQDAEAYVHRTGRTGRAGRTGTAISLITPQDIGGLYLLRLTYKIRPIERQIPTSGEMKTRAEADMVTMLADGFLPKGTHEDDRALARRLLSHDQAEGIVAGLLREYLGARPTAQDEASAQRRATVRRSSRSRRRDEALAAEEGAAGETPAAAAGEGRPREERAPRERRPREDRPRDDRPRDDRPREERPREERAPRERGPRADRPRDDRPPVDKHLEERAQADRLRDAARDQRPREERAPEAPAGDEGRPREERARRDDRGPRPDRAREERRAAAARTVDAMTSWQPPEEEGDDEPLFAPGSRAPVAAAAPAPAERTRAPRSEGAPVTTPLPASAPADGGAELFVSVGRRDGIKAPDIVRALVEGAGLAPDGVRRVRVRDRHTFVALTPADAERAIAKLHGTTLGGRTVVVELARERSEEPADEGARA